MIVTGTTTGDLSYSQTSFTPKLMITYSGGGAVGGNSDHVAHAIGFSDGTNDRAIIMTARDAQGTSNTAGEFCDDCCWISHNVSTNVRNEEANVKAFDSEGWDFTHVLATSSRDMGYIAIGGTDITNVKVGSFTSGSATGDATITGVGFQPDFVMIIGSGTATANSIAGSNAKMSVGASDGTNQYVSSVRTRDAVSTTECNQYQTTDSIIAEITEDADTIQQEASFVEFNSDGFKINWSNAGSQRLYGYLAVKGGQWEVGSASMNTATGDKDVTTAFDPVAVLFQSTGANVSELDAIQIKANLSFGSSDGTNNSNSSTEDEDAQGTSDNQRDTDSTYSLNCRTTNWIARGSCNTTLGTLKFTNTWDNVPAVARSFLYTVIGENAVGGGFAHSKVGAIIG